MCIKLEIGKMINRPIKICFKRIIVFLSPNRRGSVLWPAILSPCISRISKKTVRAKTIPVDKRNAGMVARENFPQSDTAGNNAVTMPHARAIKIVLDPGISLSFLYLPSQILFGIIFRLYERPKRLMINRTMKGAVPIFDTRKRPVPPALIAKIASRHLFCL